MTDPVADPPELQILPYERREARVKAWDPRTVEVADAIAEMIRAAGPGAVTQFLLGAEPLDAAGALSLRFVDCVVAKAELQETVTTLARRIAGHPRVAVRAYKAVIRGLANGRPISELREIQHSAHQSPELVERLRSVAQQRAAKA